MKTGLQMVKDCFALVDVPAVNTIITGACYLFERPKNSLKQDVVVNSLALTANQVQNGVVNVNIHCPNLIGVVIDSKPDDTQPDLDNIEAIAAVIIPIVKDTIGRDFHVFVQNAGLLIRDADGSWYMNIRLGYYAIQSNYTYI